MRKIVLSLSIVLLSGGIIFAQEKESGKKGKKNKNKIEAAPAPSAPVAAAAQASSLKPDDMLFADASHDFGSIPEGPDATFVFSFKNMGKEPIIIQKAQPSCGCTVPSFSGEPVPPGASGTINVAYHTKGRPNTFTKTISVISNAGTKVLTIKGNVEKAPASSVPENTSMLKTN